MTDLLHDMITLNLVMHMNKGISSHCHNSTVTRGQTTEILNKVECGYMLLKWYFKILSYIIRFHRALT